MAVNQPIMRPERAKEARPLEDHAAHLTRAARTGACGADEADWQAAVPHGRRLRGAHGRLEMVLHGRDARRAWGWPRG